MKKHITSIIAIILMILLAILCLTSCSHPIGVQPVAPSNTTVIVNFRYMFFGPNNLIWKSQMKAWTQPWYESDNLSSDIITYGDVSSNPVKQHPSIFQTSAPGSFNGSINDSVYIELSNGITKSYQGMSLYGQSGYQISLTLNY